MRGAGRYTNGMTQSALNKIKPKADVDPHKSTRKTGAWLGGFWQSLADVFRLTEQTAVAVVTGQVAPADVIEQMSVIGVDGVWIVMTICAASGAVFALYTATLALQFGFPQAVGGTLAYSFFNELGPVLGGIGFAARSGAEIAAETGTMVVTEQVDALKAMAVSPVRYLVAPRVLACILMLPLLTIVADTVGLLGSAVSANAHGVGYAVFFDSVYKYARMRDMTNGLIKSVVFGYLVGIISCMQGLRTEGGATGVGRSTTRSVVMCVVVITIADFVMASLLQQVGGVR